VNSSTSPAGTPTNSERFGDLDSLRGIAAVSVMIFHYSTFLRTRIPSFPVLGLGLSSVAGFFMISGFVISMTAEKHTFWGFVRNRAVRIFPTFWLCLALTLVLVPLLGVPAYFSAHQIAFNASMLPSFFFVKSIDDVYWTLEVELSFYCAIAILIAVGWLRWTERLVSVGLILFVAVNAAFWGGWNPAWPTSVKLMLVPLFVSGFYTQAPLLLAGMLFFRVKQSGFTPTRIVLLILCAAGPFLTYVPSDGVIIILIFGLFARVATTGIKILNHSSLKFLGLISYPLYLVHHNIGQALLGELVQVMPAFLALIVTAILILMLASVIHLVFERPVTRWLKSKLSPRKPARIDAGTPADPVAPLGPLGGPGPTSIGTNLHF
jgi:peptidoglycan/LPS O-acetylase OafA/YrhL